MQSKKAFPVRTRGRPALLGFDDAYDDILRVVRTGMQWRYLRPTAAVAYITVFETMQRSVAAESQTCSGGQSAFLRPECARSRASGFYLELMKRAASLDSQRVDVWPPGINWSDLGCRASHSEDEYISFASLSCFLIWSSSSASSMPFCRLSSWPMACLAG